MDNDTESKLGNLGILLFFIGIYMFLFGLIRARATSGFTVFFGGLVTFFVEVLGGLTLVVALSSTHYAREFVLYFFFGISCVLYIVLLIKAHKEDAAW